MKKSRQFGALVDIGVAAMTGVTRVNPAKHDYPTKPMTPQDRLAAALEHTGIGDLLANGALAADPTIAADMTVGEQIRLHGYTLTNQQAADMERGARLTNQALRAIVWEACDLFAATMGNKPAWDWREHMRRYIADAVIDRAALTEPDR